MAAYPLVQRLGQTDSSLNAIVKAVVDNVMAAAMPTLKDIVAKSAEAAEPTIRTVVREEVMPKVTLGVVAGMLGVGGIAALIGSFFASRTKAAGSGSSSRKMSGLEGVHMTQASVHSPPPRAKAADGNLVHELRASARELADDMARKRQGQLAGGPGAYRPGAYKPGAYRPDPGLGLALVRGAVDPGTVIAGALTGVPLQQILSNVIFQKTLGAKPMVADGVSGLVGVLGHLIFRTSFTLGLGTSLLLPLVADLTGWAMAQFGVNGGAALAGARPPLQRPAAPPPQRITVSGLRQQLAQKRVA